MRFVHLLAATLLVAPAVAAAQSSNTSSNSSSNNGVVRERVVDTYCDAGYCERTVSRRNYRDDGRRGYRRWHRGNDSYAYRGRYRDERRWDRYRDRDDDDDD